MRRLRGGLRGADLGRAALVGAALVGAACGGPSGDSAAPAGPPAPDPTCVGLYGAPNENTGLDAETCIGTIPGDAGTWTPPAWAPADVDGLGAWTLLDPPTPPAEDPYLEAAPTRDPDAVCGVLPEGEGPGAYRLETYADPSAAAAAGAWVTHGGACGLCSSLEDLAVYAGISDLTQPVRACGLEGFFGAFEDTVSCLEGLGFTPPCARIWAYNAQHTQQECQDTCLALLDAPYHTSDGALNDCLQCDEDESGPVFKAVAGRTRRNSGLATALCRPCDTVWRVEHGYRAP